ncbi:hypothetical protein [Sorangium sp. So ce233]|uniref:hypothetical protein n=1 Tax=Sorangium sp. So ce233 TaxID=3133290 RepID=UPI003F630B66
MQEPEQHQGPGAPGSVNFTAWLSPEEIRSAHTYADEVLRVLQERAATLRDGSEAQAHQLRRYASGLLLAGAKALAAAERVEAAGEVAGAPEVEETPAEGPAAAPEPPAQPKRGPGRPRGPRAPGGPMPPPVMRARTVEQSVAPVPAAPRRQQPTAEEVLSNRPARPPQRRATGGEWR